MTYDVTTFTLPAWVHTVYFAAFFWGFSLAAVIRIIRGSIRWYKRVGGSLSSGSED